MVSRSFRLRESAMPSPSAGHRLRRGEGPTLLRVLLREIHCAALRQMQLQNQGRTFIPIDLLFKHQCCRIKYASM